MIQTIKCPCGKIFAASREPYCYTDSEWQRNMRRYVANGCSVSVVNSGEWKFEKCECPNMKKPDPVVQQSLFTF
jgi:hypothetical protein